jgi:ankyrin repeat protein
MRGYVDEITFLIDHGADVNAKDVRGTTPLKLCEAASKGIRLTLDKKPGRNHDAALKILHERGAR